MFYTAYDQSFFLKCQYFRVLHLKKLTFYSRSRHYHYHLMRNALSAEGRNNSVPFLHWWRFDKAVKQLEVSAGFRRWWIDLATPLSSDVIFSNLKW